MRGCTGRLYFVRSAGTLGAQLSRWRGGNAVGSPDPVQSQQLLTATASPPSRPENCMHSPLGGHLLRGLSGVSGSRTPCVLLFFRDDTGDRVAARGHRGRGSLADQLVAVGGPPAMTPASDGENSASSWYTKAALNKCPQSSQLVACVASAKANGTVAPESCLGIGQRGPLGSCLGLWGAPS